MAQKPFIWRQQAGVKTQESVGLHNSLQEIQMRCDEFLTLMYLAYDYDTRAISEASRKH